MQRLMPSFPSESLISFRSMSSSLKTWIQNRSLYTFETLFAFENIALFRTLPGSGLAATKEASNMATADSASLAMFEAFEKGAGLACAKLAL
ncbi:MAG: hypothetical protein U0176_04170 [Bacteroidia bacterium]